MGVLDSMSWCVQKCPNDIFTWLCACRVLTLHFPISFPGVVLVCRSGGISQLVCKAVPGFVFAALVRVWGFIGWQVVIKVLRNRLAGLVKVKESFQGPERNF
jgi:hypothetical protein